MATSGLYGSTSTGTVAPQSGSESVGLYGNNTVFGGSYFEYLIFLDSVSTPATPTGGSWSFVTNTGTPPTGWSNIPPQVPTGKVWISIALVNSKSTATLTWSTPGIFANPAGTGTVTSVAALTLGTTGTDVSSTVSNPTIAPVITLNLPTASATNRGALSAADWTTFNSKGSGTVTSVTGTSPVVSSGGATPAISMAAATTSTNGYLTSTDWNTFNNKGTVTSVSGTTGRVTSTGGTTPVIDLASGVATPGTTGSASLVPVITVDTYGRVTSITTAANPQGTVTSVTGTAPVVSSGGATPAISMAAATASVNGYLTSADWTTFNSKGSGSVTSVAATVPSFLSVSGSPITTSGTLALTYSGTALPVANGGTGVTASSGANSVVLRDASVNISVNSISEGYSNVAAAGTTTTLTVASVPNYVVTGSGGQTYQLPDATTLPNGVNYTFNNNQSSGTIVVKNNSGTTIATIQSGGLVDVSLLSNSIAAGSWDVHNLAPSNVSWSTNTFDYPGSITSATWNGVAVAVNRGGTGLSAGTSGGVPYFSSTSTIASSAALAANALVIGGGAGVAPSTTTTGTGVVTALGVNTGSAGAFIINGGALGTPSSGTLTNATGLPLTTGVTGTLPVANGGTGLTTTPANGALDIGNGTGFTRTTLTAGTGISVTNASGSITIAATNSGTVTSVTGTSPVVSSGGATPAISLAASYGDTQNPYASKTANYVLAAPNGSAGVPTFRAVVAADIPTLNQNTTGSAGSVTNSLTSGTGISFSSGTTYNGSAAITVNNSLPMVYPGAGIPNSTGTAWGTSYSTTGSGTVLALATSPSFTTPILGTPTSGNFSSGSFTWPTFNQNTTGNAATATSATTATNIAGGVNLQIPYNTGSGATSFITAPTIGSTYLQYTGTGFAWASAAGLGTVTSVAATVPSFLSITGSPITTAGTLAISYSGTALPIANGGTGQTTATAAFNALSPITTTGDLILGNGTNSATRLGIGANTYVLTSNGTTASWAAASGGGGSGLSWQSVQTASFTAVSGNAYPINTTSGGITATLPASPTAGNYVCFTDYAGTFATNFLQINPNGNKIDGDTSSVSITQARESIHLVYIDATQGWIPYAGFNTVTPVTGYPVEYLVVAGGAGGGANIGGGGGAGGYRTATGFSLDGGTSYTVTVGAGGAAGVTGGSAFQGGTGSNSVFSTITSTGGGGGGYASAAGAVNGTAGGSGGGGGSLIDTAASDAYGGAGTSGQGFRGGNVSSSARGSGGGGGASAAGGDTSTDTNGAGGAGTASSISGSSLTYAGGGGGGGYPNSGGAGGSGGGGAGGSPTNGTGTAGTANTGGGGGGGGGGAAPGGNGAAGGSGIVVIKYVGAQRGTGGTVTSAGGYTIHTFTSSGTYVA